MAVLHRAFRQIACSPQNFPEALALELRALQNLYEFSDKIKTSAQNKATKDSTEGASIKDGPQNPRDHQSNPGHSHSQSPQTTNPKPNVFGINPPFPPITLALNALPTPLDNALTPAKPRSLPPSKFPHLPPSPTTSWHGRSSKRAKIINVHNIPSDELDALDAWRYGPHATAQDVIDSRMGNIVNVSREAKTRNGR